MTDIFRTRVERLLRKDIRVDDLTRLFLFARDRCDGRESVQEIGDFVAHHEQRTKGIITRETRDWFIVVCTIIPAMKKPFDIGRLPPHFREFLEASHRRMGKNIKKISPSSSSSKIPPFSLLEARKVLPNLIAKFVANSDGTLCVSLHHTARELELMVVLSSCITSRPAFDAERLFYDFSETLKSERLLRSNEEPAFRQSAFSAVALFAVSVMHNCVVQIGDGSVAKLTAVPEKGSIGVCAAVPVKNSKGRIVQVLSALFHADLAPKDHCSEVLLKLPSPWQCELEVNGSGKLDILT